MSKKKKVMIICLGIITLAFVSTIIVISSLPKIYLAHKYGTQISEYKIERFVPGYFMYDIDYWTVKWNNPKWECKTDNREFNVVFLDNHFFDDYQMEDVEQWILKELQTNVDENICFVSLGAHDIYGMYDESNSDTIRVKNTLWNEHNIKKIIQQTPHPNIFFYYNSTENPDEENARDVEEISKRIDEMYESDFYYSDKYICLQNVKPERIMLYGVDDSPSYYSCGLEENEIISVFELENSK